MATQNFPGLCNSLHDPNTVIKNFPLGLPKFPSLNAPRLPITRGHGLDPRRRLQLRVAKSQLFLATTWALTRLSSIMEVPGATLAVPLLSAAPRESVLPFFGPVPCRPLSPLSGHGLGHSAKILCPSPLSRRLQRDFRHCLLSRIPLLKGF